MSPNIFSCDPQWTQKLVKEQEKVVLVAWSEKSNMNGLTEKLADLESEGVPVMVVDCDVCGVAAESMNLKPGEVAVYKAGVEVAKVVSTGNIDTDVTQIKQVAGG
ncbi:MAG: hypothetical protein PHU23_05980 [Dehalococcoidales bacterium]|nr:hypothetical protein [Dehalococcoidales bacterium]